LEITYALHVTVARFRILCHRYEDKKEVALARDPVALELRHKGVASAVLARTLYQDLNPEPFLRVLLDHHSWTVNLTGLDSVTLDRTALDPRRRGAGSLVPDDALTFDEPLAAARTFVEGRRSGFDA
jgi:hypothetical protein